MTKKICIENMLHNTDEHLILLLSVTKCCSFSDNKHKQLVRTLVYDRRTYPDLHHDVQLTGDLLEVNCLLYISQLSHPSSFG